MGKPTFSMIAASAGVGTATVERVLNGRGGVRPETAARVVAAARALDWPGRLPERHRGILRIEVLLVRPDSSFFSRLARAFRRIAATLDSSVQVLITYLDEADPGAIARHIASPTVPRTALVLATPDAPAIREALGAAIAAGLPVVQAVSRSVAEAEFVGIDNYAAGRTGALLLSRMCAAEGAVVAFCHGGSYEVHRSRLRGFSDYFLDHAAPGLRFVWAGFAQDSQEVSVRRLHETFRQWPDFVALYNAGGGNTAVLGELAARGRKIFFVGHELTEASAAALRSGVADVILDQSPEAQARRAVDIVLARLGLTDIEVENPPIRFTTVTAENI